MSIMQVSEQHTIPLELGENSYNIHIGSLSATGEQLSKLVANRQLMIITDKNVANKCSSDTLFEQLAEVNELGEIILKSGEKHKTLNVVGDICRFAAKNNFDRKSLFLAFGGGVTGDMTGFAAAIYKRGINFIQVPTTLLAMVDSSVGGKTGVDIAEGKNLIGSFHQPLAVLIDPEFLSSLPKKEWRNGLAEVIKYGVIYDAEFFKFLVTNKKQLLKQPSGDFYAQIIKRCCEIKATVVAQDEKESGLRAILNYGHTFGHAAELLSNYKLSHGEAVAYGMVLAGRLAVKMQIFSAQKQQRIEKLLAYLKLPVTPPLKLSASDMVAAMQGDKKNEQGKIKLILPEDIGKVRIESNLSSEELLNFLQGQL